MENFTHTELWKNFQLGNELAISGSFIYNGLHCFELMQIFYHEEEAFEFLYNISVGIERLQKIAIVLSEHTEIVDQENFEKSLITHNHIDLHKRIEKSHAINFGKVHLKFLSLLSNFYKSSRYEKYILDRTFNWSSSRTELVHFLEENLKQKISIDFLGCTENDDSIKKFIGKVVGKFCAEYYSIILNQCSRLNIYTYELVPNSKASKIFHSKKYDFSEEKIAQQEIIKHLMQSDFSTNAKRFLDQIPPINLEFYDTNYYINYLMCFHKKGGIGEELEELYTEIDNISERFKHLKFIGNEDVNFD
jgi:hypothetical protein